MIAKRTSMRRRRHAADAGSAAVEFALICLPVILLALGTFDYFAANYETTALEAAARAIGEYVRDDSTCGASGFDNGTCDPSSLWSTMQSNNNSLSGAAQSTLTYYTCADNSGASTSPPTCSVSCGTGCTDTRVIEYVQVTVTESSWTKMFSWDPWSSLTVRMSTRVQ